MVQIAAGSRQAPKVRLAQCGLCVMPAYSHPISGVGHALQFEEKIQRAFPKDNVLLVATSVLGTWHCMRGHT